jgi:dephospho-CoA kinase
LNRAKLGGIIFSDPSKRQLLNTCTHVIITLDTDERT